jgi:hypothetical protein
MSEYQYYEFLAIDRPLKEDEMAELRALSTRATITAVSLTNENFMAGHLRRKTLIQRLVKAGIWKDQ